MAAKAETATVSMRTLLEVCGNLGVCAGEILREVHQLRLRGGKDGLKMIDKGAKHGGGFDPQTIADRRSEKLIVNGLRQAFGPDLCIVGEESGLAPGKRRDEEAEQDEGEDQLQETENIRERIRLNWWSKAEEDIIVPMTSVSVWIDPLDATREYTEAKVEFCTVLIGIAIDGRSTAGVMVEPFAVDSEHTICWWGIKQKGCFRTVVGSNETSRVQFTRKEPFQAGGRIAVSRARVGGMVQQFTSRYTSILESYNVDFSISFSGGCGHKILLVLKQVADFYPFPCSGTSLWDSCAGDALLDAAGGLLTDKFGRRLVFDPKRTSFENPHGLLAANDDRICKFASESIASCLDYTRNLKFEFFTNEFLANVLRVNKVFYFETPSASLIVDRKRGLIQYDLVATCDQSSVGGEKRRLEYRRFEGSNFYFEPASQDSQHHPKGMVRILARKAAEAHFLDEMVPAMASSEFGIRFSGQVRLLERSTSRRPPTLADVIARYRDGQFFSKLFLQSVSFLSMVEPVAEHEKHDIASQAEFLRKFHEFFWSRADLADRVAETGWRWTLDTGKHVFTPSAVSKMRRNASTMLARLRHGNRRDLEASSAVAGSGRAMVMARDEEDEEADEQFEEELYAVARQPRLSGTADSTTRPLTTRRRKTVIRGIFKRHAADIHDLGYCAAIVENDAEAPTAHLQDLVHLLILNGSDPQTNLNNLNAIKRVYFNNQVDDRELARKLKCVMFRYLQSLLAGTAVFFHAFEKPDTQQRAILAVDALCSELETSGAFNGTDLTCFGVLNSNAKL